MKRTMVIAMAALLVVMLPALALAGKDVRKVEKTFELKMGGNLNIEIRVGGDIVIEGWDRDEVVVKAKITGRHRDDVELDFEKKKSGLEIIADIDHKRDTRANCDLYIMVPEKFDIEFETMGGDVSIKGVDGEITGETMGGDVDFEGLTGYLAVTTMGGDITVLDSEVDGKVKTMGGDVDIKNVKGDLKGSTMGGDVTYENVVRADGSDEEVTISTMGGDLALDYAGKNIKAKTYGGDIDVRKAEKVNVSTMGGDITVEEAPAGAKVKTMGGDIEIGSAGDFVDANTMGGDITVDDIDGWVKAETMGGNVDITMTGDPGEGKRDVEIKSMGGDIALTVPKGLSMKFDIEIQWTKNCERKPKIVSDLDIDIEETKEWKRKWGSKRKYIYGTGKTGGGKHVIKIRTINGDVHINEE
ncbi:MAG: DUF4097 family beta strand repeat protein [Candidatus Krumholzibacteria bacterium]|nr:DUF4097 family beta strand repeat protein [Candidatus Krumholzibacteria bacterium]